MRNLRRYFFGSLAALAMTLTAHAECPGGTWGVNANGLTGLLQLSCNNGIITGTLYGDQISGFWNDSAKRLMFYRAINGNTSYTPPEQIQVYTAYMYPADASNPTSLPRLAGYFEAFSGTGAT